MTEKKDLKWELEALYASYGYEKYRMAGFEEYALYLENKSFLTSDKMITFNDLDGRLMALKPDVTLSIVKNALPASGVGKYYYTESVFRPNRASDGFKELTQTGLEAIGDIDAVTVTEAVELALKSLEHAGGEYVLVLSDVRFTEGLVHAVGKGAELKEELRDVIAKKRTGEVEKISEKYSLRKGDAKTISEVINLPPEPLKALDKASKYAFGKEANIAIDELRALVCAFSGTRYAKKIQIDFSITGNTNYYNGILFSGYIEGIAGGVLKGGRYDKLVGEEGKGAVGFALYTDEITEKYFSEARFADVVIDYDGTDIGKLLASANALRAGGKSVTLVRGGKADYRFRKGELIKNER